MLPQSIHRPRNLILFALAVLAALTALALVRAPQGHAVEYPYPYPEEPVPNPTPTPTNPYPNPYPSPTPEPTPQPPTSTGSGTARVVKEAQNKELGHKILTNNQGRTLYSLSAEKNGRFICAVSACLSVWKPLTVKAGVKPVGPVHLGTIVRPDGRTQVTYRGLPLYRFTGDTKPGDVSGEGIHDVGVWHAAGGKR
jgi:predicted lipoprotein with Yx(FWY)xxD motif